MGFLRQPRLLNITVHCFNQENSCSAACVLILFSTIEIESENLLLKQNLMAYFYFYWGSI